MSRNEDLVGDAIFQIQNLEESLKKNAKGILSSTMKEEIKSLVKESLKEEDEIEDEEVETEVPVDTDNADEVEDVEDETPEDESEEDLNAEFDNSGIENDNEEEVAVNMTRASDSELYKVFSKMGPNDGIEVVKDDKPDKDTWAVGEDGPNVEIRSRHMRQTGNDFNIISKVGNWVSDQATHGKTGMHVHIGVPSDFDMFDVLAMSTLVDEKAIKSAVAMDRDFNSFAKLRRSLSNAIYNRIHEYMRRQSENVPKSFTLTNAQMKEVLAHFDRNHGTNIAAFSEHKTIEFRYLGSDMADQVLKWISYFLLLPRIAKSRNQIKLDTIYNEQIVATRLPGKIKFDNVSLRSFCTNNNAAYVAVEETYGDISYNGHGGETSFEISR